MLDIAIEQNTGYMADIVEECLCPAGYEGLSCESCARGYYRDNFDKTSSGAVGSCKPCDCNGNEISCRSAQQKLICECKDGFEGEKCERPSGGKSNLDYLSFI